MRLMEGDHVGPFNLGNPGEFTMLELAQVVFMFFYIINESFLYFDSEEIALRLAIIYPIMVNCL